MPHTIIDAHCHLDFECFDDDRIQVIKRAKQNHISDIIIPGTQKKYWSRIQRLCTQVDLHACYGLHPYWCDQHTLQDLVALEQIITNEICVAVGECGLDYRPQQADKKDQLNFFEAQLNIASNAKLPVVIHSVRATDDTIKTLKNYSNLRGMVHSYSGSLEQAKQLIDMGFYISIGGSVTFNNAKKIRETTKKIPLSALLIETDAPDQTDISHKNERNEPAYLINILEEISILRDDEINLIARQSRQNTQKLFGLK